MRSIPAFYAVAIVFVTISRVHAQSEPTVPMKEVVVQASLRGDTVEKLPTSTTVLGARTLEVAGVQHFEDVLGLVPNLNWSSGTSRPRYFQLRGIGELDQFQGAPNASVGFLIDDIDFSGIGMPATLYDVEQIEVLRGPQGTTYGANALAGLISMRTRDPQPRFELRAEATGGDYGTSGTGAVLNAPLGDGAAFRLVAQRYRSDGFRHDAFLNRNDTNGYDETTLRGKLHWTASEALKLDLTALYANLDNGYDAFAIDNSRTTQSDRPGRDAQRSFALSTRAEYTGFYRFVLRNTATYADSHIAYSYDADWGNDVFWGANTNYSPYDYFQSFPRHRRTWSEDLRLVSAPGAEIAGRATWLAGLYVLDARETNAEHDFRNDVGFDDTGYHEYNSLDSAYHSTNYAAYGEIDMDFTPRTRFSAGARLEHRNADYHDTHGEAFNPGESMVGGHVSVEYAPRERRNIYVTLSRGYRAGGFNIGLDVPEDRRQFAAEYLWNLETGLKASSASGRVNLQGDVFYMRRSNQQVSTSIQPDPQDPATFTFFTDNAAHGENYGVESALTWFATPRLMLGGNLGLLHTRYLGYEVAGRNLDGREQAHAPQYQLGLTAQYQLPQGFLARLDTQSVDDFYFDTSHDERSRAYTLVNLKIGYERGTWAAYAWARNLFNEGYAQRGFFFGDEPPDFNPRRYVQPGDPRQVGVTFNYSFR